jgi:hypothetical protein
VNAQYNVLSGRRVVATRSGPSAREVALDYVRSLGCHRNEIIYYGVDGVSWRGAIYRAELSEPRSSGPDRVDEPKRVLPPRDAAESPGSGGVLSGLSLPPVSPAIVTPSDSPSHG